MFQLTPIPVSTNPVGGVCWNSEGMHGHWLFNISAVLIDFSSDAVWIFVANGSPFFQAIADSLNKIYWLESCFFEKNSNQPRSPLPGNNYNQVSLEALVIDTYAYRLPVN